MKVLSLNGIYSLYSDDKEFNCSAVIPGSDFGNLIRNGLIEDPLNAPDGREISDRVAEKCFTFEKIFHVDGELLKSDNITLNFEKLDTICKVYLNSQEILSSCNTHISYCCDVKGILTEGENTLSIHFDSALNYVKIRQSKRPLPPNSNGVNGAQYLRKANCHFGWDWGPCVPYCYCGNVELRFFDREIKNIVIRQKTTEEKSEITVKADNADGCYIIAPDGTKIQSDNFKFIIEFPDLWYTADLSEKKTQPLYTVVLENDEMTAERKIGLRDIKLNTEKDEWGNNFQFVLNGKRVFAKGANVIPFAAIPEYAEKDSVDSYIELAAKSNFNMIRIWGGGEYASDYLLSRCDELGILVWQDFCFACMMYPFDEKEFVENVRREAEFIIKRMDYHPSIALLCGNNEIEETNAFIPRTSKLVKGYIDYFYNILPKIVKDLTDLPFIPTSPVGKAPFTENTSENLGDSHMWSVWHGLMPLDYYGTRYARFLSEFGLESLPSRKAIDKFAKGDKSVYSPAFTEHQKCVGGNMKLMYYLCERFNKDVDFDLLPYLTGIMQAECIKAATEHFRRNKGRCNGSVFWQFNDVWNAPSWSAVDFEKVPKALMYKAEEFFAPVTLSYNKDCLYIHNDTLSDKNITLEYSVTNGGVQKWVYRENIVSKADSVEKLHDIPLSEGDILCVDLNGKRYIYDCIKNLKKVKLSAVRNGNSLTVSSDGYAENVCIEGDAVADVNYFSLMPGEEKTVNFDGEIGEYRILCENNIKYRKKSLRKSMFRFMYRLRPKNFAQYMWYKLH